ncbi:MAG TPA: hypothetical protein VER08_06065, partial [Pyrinomonadaceae bacterium]|nr:hypothetical protein [Pyrinomonadaceae bacterium]
MPRTFARRAGSVSTARRPLAVFAFLAAACWVALGFAPFSTQVVSSQGQAAARTLSVAERVRYQRAVDEVYWRHTAWPHENAAAKPSLDEVMTTEQTAAKVEETLRKSEALARHFGRPVTPEQLQAEVTRMARETKRPAVLRELFAALDGDPFVVAEVLARPALVNRLVLNSFEADEQDKAASEAASFDAWWATASDEFVGAAPEATDFNYQLAEINQAGAGADDTWSPMQALPVATGTAVWTGSEVVIWGGLTQYGGRTNSGARYNPATDTWSPTSTVGAPRERSGNAAYWTGTEMLIWGGTHGSNCAGDGPCRPNLANTGGRYNPLTDTWTPTSISGAPFTSGLTVWTGSKLLVWGGGIHTYDPASDVWKTTTPTNTPAAGVQRAVWTGTELFVWGDADNTTGKRGGIYNPETNTWRQPNTLNAPSNRNNFSMVWTGREVVVWGGYEGNFVTLNTGGRYNPSTDTWTPTSTTGAPAARYGHVAVWTGSEMVVHGGDLRPGGQMGLTNTGARYDPAKDSWTPTQAATSPVKFAHVAVWTGTEVFVWGGSTGSGSFQKEGARYSPSRDAWTPVNRNDAPLYLDRGVWTGTEMLVWGYNSLCYECSISGGSVGARYDPATNVWRPMNLSGAPAPYVSGYGT